MALVGAAHLTSGAPPFCALDALQDVSLDELIKKTAKDKPKFTAKGGAAAGKAPGGGKGRGKKGKAPGGPKPGGGGQSQLMKDVATNNKAKRANKLAKARGMDIEMQPVKAVTKKTMKGAKGGGAAKKGGAVGKLANTLKARIEAAKKRMTIKGVAPGGGRKAGKGGGTPAKAGDIKITIAGSNAMAGKGKAVVKPGGKGGKGRGAGRAPGGGKGRGGSIVKPGAAIKSGINRAAGAIGKKGKPRTVVVAGMGQGGRAPGGGKGRGGKGRGGKARGAGRAGLTLAQRFGGRGRK